MALRPIKKRRLFEEIIISIEQYIQEEKIGPGEKLPSENDLATIFNVSKTAVREAMSVLNATGIIETRPGAGIFLKDISGETIVQRVTENLMDKGQLQEILEFRRGMEVEAVSLATLRGTADDLLKIKEAHGELVKANREGRIGVKEDYLFHYSIILAAHNSIYKDVFHAVSEKLEEGIRVSKMHSIKQPGLFEEGYREHEAIIQALERRDAEEASRAMRHHLVRNEQKIWMNYKNKK